MSEPILHVRMERALPRFFLGLLAFELLLLLADLSINHAAWVDSGPVRRFFNVAREDSLGSWFSVSQTLLVGLTLLLIARLAVAEGAGRFRRYGWTVLACFFLYMALDDGAQFHERVGTIFERKSGPKGIASAFPTYTWQLVFGPFFAAMAAFMLYFFWREFAGSRRRLLLLGFGLGLFAVAVGLDFIEGLDPEATYNPILWMRNWANISRDDAEHYVRAAEETLEMMGMSYCWVAFLWHLGARYPHFSVRLAGPGGALR